MKKITFTMDDWMYDETLSYINTNKSLYIRDKFYKGFKEDIGEVTKKNEKLTQLFQENKNLIEENHKLKLLVGSLKQKLENKSVNKDANPDNVKIIFDDLGDYALSVLEQCVNLISEKPSTFNGNYNWFKLETNLTLSKDQFRELLEYSKNI